jgi:hypothetical protein
VSRAQCRSCQAEIVWVRSATTGKAIPCNPEIRVEYLVPIEDATAEQRATGIRTTLITPEGQAATGILGTVLTPFAREWRGRISHFATCTTLAAIRAAKKGARHDD